MIVVLQHTEQTSMITGSGAAVYLPVTIHSRCRHDMTRLEMNHQAHATSRSLLLADRKLQQSNRKYQTPPPASGAPDASFSLCAALTNPCCPLLSQFEYTLISHRLFLAIMCKYDVIHKTGTK